jgi:hypothetical protein
MRDVILPLPLNSIFRLVAFIKCRGSGIIDDLFVIIIVANSFVFYVIYLP